MYRYLHFEGIKIIEYKNVFILNVSIYVTIYH